MDLDKRYIPLLLLSLLTGASFGCLSWVPWSIPFLFLASTLYLYIRYFYRIKLQEEIKRSIILFVVLLILCSWGFISLRKPSKNTQNFISNQPYRGQGKVITQPLYYPNSIWLHVKTSNGKVQCKLAYDKTKTPTIETGSIISFCGTVEDLSKYSEDPELYLKKRNIVASIIVSKDTSFVVEPPTNIFRIFLNKTQNFIEKSIVIATRDDPALKEILNAILLNKKGNIDVNAYAEIGIAHLLSISGMHFTIVSILLLAIFLLLPFHQIYKCILFELLLLLYLSIISFPLPAVRAFIMLSFVSLSVLVKRKTEPFYALMIAAFILVLLQPSIVLTVSFWFSFLATAALCIPGNGVQKTVYLFSSVSLVSAYSFHMISVVSIFSSVFFSFFLLPFFVWGIFSIFLPGVSSLLLYPLFSMLYDGLLFIAKAFRSVPGSWRYISCSLQGWIAVIIGIVFCLFILAYYTGFSKRLKQMIACVLLISIPVLFLPIHSDNARITFFNVGDGDSIFIQSSQGNFLIDAGEWDGTFCPAETVIVPYLKKWGINHIDALLLTHYHSDHYGGIPYIVSHIPDIDVLLLPNTVSSDKENFFAHMKENDGFRIPCKFIYNSMSYNHSDESKLTILPVYRLYPAEMEVNENNKSIVCRYQCKNISFLFTGDLEAEGENVLLKHCRSTVQATILKVGHHGSNTSSTDSFLKAVNPKYAIISCGKYSFHKHPSATVIERLRLHSIPVATTHNEGTIVLETNGDQVWLAEQ